MPGLLFRPASLAAPARGGTLWGMELAPERILANLREVRDRIAAAAARSDRPAETVRLVAVTMTVGEDVIRILAQAGQKDLGENRAQQLRDRAAALADLRVAWHMIGRLQKKNAKYVVPAAAMIHSVDSVELAAEIGKRAVALGRRATCLLEVNSGEEQKAGVEPSEAPALARAIAATPGISLAGLMTMAPLAEDPEASRPAFTALRKLLEQINREAALPQPLTELSMGMTQDYEVAIEEGATIVRVGTALFR
ncbi:MAG: YggS family pyridoxal phosphate-dependent enzyme [Planctomycetota bacterium]|nr:YggS family pyridoxal phosphate-dependent enzyme [Planctomycetota bacterium]